MCQNIPYLARRSNSAMWPSESGLHKTWTCICSWLQKSTLVWKVQLFFVRHRSENFRFPLHERHDTLVYRAISSRAARTLRSNLSSSVTQHHGNVSKLLLCYTFWYWTGTNEVWTKQNRIKLEKNWIEEAFISVAGTMTSTLAAHIKRQNTQHYTQKKQKKTPKKRLVSQHQCVTHPCTAAVASSLSLECMPFTIWPAFQLPTPPVCSCVMVLYVMVGWIPQLCQSLLLPRRSEYVHARARLPPHLPWAPGPPFFFF